MAMQTMENKDSSLDPVQEHMLGAIIRLDESRPPGYHHPYPMIHDEARRHKVELDMADLRKAKRPLIERGLIADNGCGFKATPEGVQFYQSRIKVRPANIGKDNRPTAH
jgi:hypothetical protein